MKTYPEHRNLEQAGKIVCRPFNDRPGLLLERDR